MLKVSHTLGPWAVNAEHPRDIDAAGHLVAVAQPYWGENFENPNAYAEAEANARLIASAPDMLAALTALTIAAEAAGWDMEPENRAALDNARAAIAHAERGE